MIDEVSATETALAERMQQLPQQPVAAKIFGNHKRRGTGVEPRPVRVEPRWQRHAPCGGGAYGHKEPRDMQGGDGRKTSGAPAAPQGNRLDRQHARHPQAGEHSADMQGTAVGHAQQRGARLGTRDEETAMMEGMLRASSAYQPQVGGRRVQSDEWDR